ncbi:hypothetical protein VC83_06573 [Pseudogymnoascus destructans]|uniref:Uncharacterized protein n=1 Tax=Pseudogymnoascus destructans TaxID=655981 RepID=A0A177AAY7_9PEZI|nr:uncharacterized protein VC83_06573 [Pseudogymnoascus destructans]OAF58343.1 hypothetical protein VC83_06573 [Pseudogymnoascus destructans]
MVLDTWARIVARMSCGYDLLRELLYMDCKCSGMPSVGGEKATPTTAGELGSIPNAAVDLGGFGWP